MRTQTTNPIKSPGSGVSKVAVTVDYRGVICEWMKSRAGRKVEPGEAFKELQPHLGDLSFKNFHTTLIALSYTLWCPLKRINRDPELGKRVSSKNGWYYVWPTGDRP